jgi:hypothetical protein
MGKITNNQGIVTQGQTGNNTINVGQARLPFDPAIGDQLADKLPAGKPIDLMGVGSRSDWAVAEQYAQYLRDKGFDVTVSASGVLIPIPDHKISIVDTGAPRVKVIIAPAAS